jgi:hypothetical protein
MRHLPRAGGAHGGSRRAPLCSALSQMAAVDAAPV